MKVIFMGTPDFSVGTLEALIEAGHEVVLAVTQPDKPKGRGGKMQYTPVKEAALANIMQISWSLSHSDRSFQKKFLR